MSLSYIRRPLIMLELDKNTFEAEVLKAEGKILVDFYGDG